MIYPKSYTSLGQEKGPGLSFPYFTEEDIQNQQLY